MNNQIIKKNQNNLYGVVDTDNNIIIPFNYHRIEEINDTGLYLAFCLHGKVKEGKYVRDKVIFNSNGDELNFNTFDSCEIKEDTLTLTFKNKSVTDFKKVNSKINNNRKRRPEF